MSGGEGGPVVERLAAPSRYPGGSVLRSVVVCALLCVPGLVVVTAAPAYALPSSGFGKGPGYCVYYSATHASPRYSYRDVWACAPVATVGPTPFDNDGTRSFQCVGLSARFLWVVYGIWAGPGQGISFGSQLVAVVHRKHPSIPLGVPGPGSVPAPGDVISMGPGGPTDAVSGHTAVVISANQRTGQFTVMSQNEPDGSAGEQTWQIDLSGRHNGLAELDGQWASASWLELAAQWPPSNGSFLTYHHRLYRMAGGAPLAVRARAALGGSLRTATITDAHRWARLNRYPVNGTCLEAVSSNGTDTGTYVVAGGAPLVLHNVFVRLAAQPCVSIDASDLSRAGRPRSHLRRVPVNATFLRTAQSGAIVEVAGGYPFSITNCRVIGGCPRPVTVDQWDIVHAGRPASHLDARPTSSARLEVVPSRRYWRFTHGRLLRTSPSRGAVRVDPGSLQALGSDRSARARP